MVSIDTRAPSRCRAPHLRVCARVNVRDENMAFCRYEPAASGKSALHATRWICVQLPVVPARPAGTFTGLGALNVSHLVSVSCPSL